MPQSLLKPCWRGQRCRHSSFSGAEAHSMRPHAQSSAHSTHVLTDMHQGSLSPLPLSHTPLHTHTHCPVHLLLPRRAVSQEGEQSLWPSCALQSRGRPLTIIFKSLCENRGFEVCSLAVIQCRDRHLSLPACFLHPWRCFPRAREQIPTTAGGQICPPGWPGSPTTPGSHPEALGTSQYQPHSWGISLPGRSPASRMRRVLLQIA